MKLNLGCGQFKMDGFVNVDLHADNADVKGDFTEMDFEDVEEVEMSHILEHLAWNRTNEVLNRVRSWMVPGAPIRIEVPDIQFFIERGILDLAAKIAIYGIQSAPGEYHLTGFTEFTLRAELEKAGFTVTSSRRFSSDHPARPNFPCIEMTAVA